MNSQIMVVFVSEYNHLDFAVMWGAVMVSGQEDKEKPNGHPEKKDDEEIYFDGPYVGMVSRWV
jgi:hypothetical protein